MTRRSGQVGYIERKGNAFYVRSWLDVPGQEARKHMSVRICPVSGPGGMTKPERERRAKEIITESGADTEAHFEKIEVVNLGVAFRQQAEKWLNHVQTRQCKPIKPATAKSRENCMDRWLNPPMGDMPLSSVGNLAVKGRVAKDKCPQAQFASDPQSYGASEGRVSCFPSLPYLVATQEPRS